jgi:hypothetical protein
VLFVGFAVPRVASAGFFGALTLPLVLLVADLVIAVAVVTRWYPVRPVGQGLAVFGALVHALVVLRNGPLWTRGCSGVLLLAHCWALVQLFMMTAAEDDEADDFDEDAPGAEPAPLGEPMGIIETPVTEVVDLSVPDEDPAVHESPEPREDGVAIQPSTAPDDADELERDSQHDSEEWIR